MKKLALILALMLVPCAAFGLEMLDDTTMDGITGQAGVSIAVDDIQMFINIEKMAYIDCNGYTTQSGYGTCSGNPGAVAISNFQIDVLNINAIVAEAYGTDGVNPDGATSKANGDAFGQSADTGGPLGLRSVSCGDIPLFYDYAKTTGVGCQLGSTGATLGLDNYLVTNGLLGRTVANFSPRFLTIDVTDELPAATDAVQTWAAQNAGLLASNVNTVTVGGVLIGLPTAEIYINDLVMTPVYDGDIGTQVSAAANDDNNLVGALLGLEEAANYGTIELQGITFTVLGGWIEIAPH